jgi:3-dehydroquinate synthase
MEEVLIKGQADSSRILIGRPLKSLPGLLSSETAAIITDTNVRKLYGERFPDLPIVELSPGEASKDLARVGDVYQQLLEFGLNRESQLVGIGGGVVCDVTGFVGATFKRGIDFGFVATTLMAQVDAALGGKNAVNLEGYKNQIGTIIQPGFVLCDPELLKTLPERELKNGLAEAIKTGAIASPELFDFLEENMDGCLAKDLEVLEQVVAMSARIKAEVVNEDEREQGRRAILNFGHTLGHGLESTLELSHGEAVAAGMVMESSIAVKMGLMEEKDCSRLKALIKAYGLPAESRFEPQKVIDAVKKDKKRSSGKIRLPILDNIGSSRIVNIELTELEKAVYDYLC